MVRLPPVIIPFPGAKHRVGVAVLKESIPFVVQDLEKVGMCQDLNVHTQGLSVIVEMSAKHAVFNCGLEVFACDDLTRTVSKND